jgi:uncharacterized protein YqiB (DUF1249 family)
MITEEQIRARIAELEQERSQRLAMLQAAYEAAIGELRRLLASANDPPPAE